MRIARLNPLTGKREVFAPSGEYVERLGEQASIVTLAGADEKDAGGFSILAYCGGAVDRWWGKMIIDLAGVANDGQTTLLLEHDDSKPLGVIMSHEVEKALATDPWKADARGSRMGLRLKGHWLSDEASPDARMVRLRAKDQGPGKPGMRYKSSVGVRFKEYRFLKEGEEAVVNGQTYKFSDKEDTLIVTKSHLFENSLIHVNPADLGTQAEIMAHGKGVSTMGKEAEELMAAGLAGAKPIITPVTKLGDLSPEMRKALVAEAKTESAKLSADFAKAFPDRAEFCMRMIDEGRSIDQAKVIAFDETEAKARAEAAVLKDGAEALPILSTLSGRTAEGFDERGAERAVSAYSILGSVQREAEARLQQSRGAVHVFGREALGVMSRAIFCEAKVVKLEGGGEGVTISEDEIEKAAKYLLSATPGDRRHKIEQLAGGGRAALDLSKITVKGFIGGYHEAMDGEEPWGVKICHEVESNQETEIVRWLDYAPQLQVFGTGPEERNVQVRQIQFSNIWYDHTLGIDVMDFMLQKFGKINTLMGRFGSVAKKHWNKLVTAQLETNAVGYDGSTLFSTTHALGGSAPAAQNNALTSATFAWLQIPDLNNITPAQMNTVFLNASTYFSTFKTADNEPMNEDEKENFLLIAPPKWAGVARAAVFSNRLDGSQGGAGGGRDNPLKIEAERKNATWDVVNGARLASTNNFIYLVLINNDRKPILRAEPIGLSLYFNGPGSDMHKKLNKFGFWGRTLRSTCSGAWTSILRLQLG